MKNLTRKITNWVMLAGFVSMIVPQANQSSVYVEKKQNRNKTELRCSEIKNNRTYRKFNPTINIIDKTIFAKDSHEVGGRCPACSRCKKT